VFGTVYGSVAFIGAVTTIYTVSYNSHSATFATNFTFLADMKSWQRLQLQYFNKHFEWLQDISCNGSFSFQSNTLLFTIWLDPVSNVNIVNYSTSQMQLQFTIWLHNFSNYNIFKLLLWYLEFMITVATNQYLESPSPPQVLIAPQHRSSRSLLSSPSLSGRMPPPSPTDSVGVWWLHRL
jgi:hypothetical protein